VCISTNQHDTISNLNLNHNYTTKQHAVVSIQINIVTCPMYPDKFTPDYVIARFLLSVVIVTLHCRLRTQ